MRNPHLKILGILGGGGEGGHQRPPGTEILGGRECKSKRLPWGVMDICFRTAHYMYIVVRVYFSHMPVIFAVVSMLRVDCKCQAKSNVHLTESQIKTVKTWTKPKLWTGVPLIEVSAVKRELTALLSKRKTLPVAVFSLSDSNQ